MNPNEIRNKETREWLEKAVDDLESARVLAAAPCIQRPLSLSAVLREEPEGLLTFHYGPFRKAQT
jgi:hypothetical protein